MKLQIKSKKKLNNFNKSIIIDGDKSISIRWVLLSSLSKKKSTAYNLLKSINLLGNAMPLLSNKAIKTFKINTKNINESLSKNPILVTALNRKIGYGKAALIAKKAYKENKAIIDVASEETGISKSELKKLLDPSKLTKGGLSG